MVNDFVPKRFHSALRHFANFGRKMVAPSPFSKRARPVGIGGAYRLPQKLVAHPPRQSGQRAERAGAMRACLVRASALGATVSLPLLFRRSLFSCALWLARVCGARAVR